MGFFDKFRRGNELQSNRELDGGLDQTVLVENKELLKKEREKMAFEKILKDFTDFLRGSRTFSTVDDLENEIYNSGLFLPKNDNAYTYVISEMSKTGRNLSFPSRKLVINKVPFSDGEKQVIFEIEFRNGLDKKPCFFGVSNKEKLQGVDSGEIDE